MLKPYLAVKFTDKEACASIIFLSGQFPLSRAILKILQSFVCNDIEHIK